MSRLQIPIPATALKVKQAKPLKMNQMDEFWWNIRPILQRQRQKQNRPKEITGAPLNNYDLGRMTNKALTKNANKKFHQDYWSFVGKTWFNFVSALNSEDVTMALISTFRTEVEYRRRLRNTNCESTRGHDSFREPTFWPPTPINFSTDVFWRFQI